MTGTPMCHCVLQNYHCGCSSRCGTEQGSGSLLSATPWQGGCRCDRSDVRLCVPLQRTACPADLEFLTEGGGLDPATTCRVLHALIKQRQRDIERGKEAAERLARMGHDLRVRDQQREKLLAKMAAKERELGALENKVRAAWMPARMRCSLICMTSCRQ